MTSPAPNATATTEDFEFDALDDTPNYRDALIQEFGPSLRGNVMEIGAGIGPVTGLLRQLPQISRLLSIEPDAGCTLANGHGFEISAVAVTLL